MAKGDEVVGTDRESATHGERTDELRQDPEADRSGAPVHHWALSDAGARTAIVSDSPEGYL